MMRVPCPPSDSTAAYYHSGTVPADFVGGRPGDLAIMPRELTHRRVFIADASGKFVEQPRDALFYIHLDLTEWPDEVDAFYYYEDLLEMHGGVRIVVRPTNHCFHGLVTEANLSKIARFYRIGLEFQRALCEGEVWVTIEAELLRTAANESGRATTVKGSSGVRYIDTELHRMCVLYDRLVTPHVSAAFFVVGNNAYPQFTAADIGYFGGDGVMRYAIPWFVNAVDARVHFNGQPVSLQATVFIASATLSKRRQLLRLAAQYAESLNSEHSFAAMILDWPVDMRMSVRTHTYQLGQVFRAAILDAGGTFNSAVASLALERRLRAWMATQCALLEPAPLAMFRAPSQHRAFRNVVFALLQCAWLPSYCVLWLTEWLDVAFIWRLTTLQRLRIIDRVQASMARVVGARALKAQCANKNHH